MPLPTSRMIVDLYRQIVLDFLIQFYVAIGLLLVLVYLLWPWEQGEPSPSRRGRP
jgi:hypothetical protein